MSLTINNVGTVTGKIYVGSKQGYPEKSESRDLYPGGYVLTHDPATGKNTAISAALDMKFVQAFIVHDHDGQGPRMSNTVPASSAGAGRD